MLNYNRKQEKIALYRYKDVCNKNPRLQFNVTTHSINTLSAVRLPKITVANVNTHTRDRQASLTAT